MRIVGWERGIILLNSGYGSLSHDLFEQIAAREAKARSFKIFACLTARTQTNGFDTYMTWEISPKNPTTNVESKLFHAFENAVTEVMNDWGRGGFMPSAKRQPLAEPVSFEYAGKTFVWDPGLAPFSSEYIGQAVGP